MIKKLIILIGCSFSLAAVAGQPIDLHCPAPSQIKVYHIPSSVNNVLFATVNGVTFDYMGAAAKPTVLDTTIIIPGSNNQNESIGCVYNSGSFALAAGKDALTKKDPDISNAKFVSNSNQLNKNPSCNDQSGNCEMSVELGS